MIRTSIFVAFFVLSVPSIVAMPQCDETAGAPDSVFKIKKPPGETFLAK